MWCQGRGPYEGVGMTGLQAVWSTCPAGFQAMEDHERVSYLAKKEEEKK